MNGSSNSALRLDGRESSLPELEELERNTMSLPDPSIELDGAGASARLVFALDCRRGP